MRRVNAEIMQPLICSDAEIAAFCCFVRQGDEVDVVGFEARVRRAKALVFLYIDRALAGVAALKQPNRNYRDKVFKAAGMPGNAASFNLELGWVFVPSEYRGRHYSRVLSAAAVGQADGPVFATTRSDNEPMKKTLEFLNFMKIGSTWASKRGGYNLVFYVSRPKEPTNWVQGT